MEMNSTTNHTTSVKVLKDGITIRQSGDAVEGSGIQVSNLPVFGLLY